MPLFLTDEEFHQCSNDAALVAEKADAFIRKLYAQHETVKATADASSITAEQTCSILEQKYVSLFSEFTQLESQNAQLNNTHEQRLSELAQAQAEKHKAHLKSIAKDGDMEKLSTELAEIHKSKRQLMGLIEHKDAEINEKNATIKSYLEKIVNMTNSAAVREAKLNEVEVELARYQTSSSRLSQEKELIEKHNTWLNDELTAKVNSLIEVRKAHSDVEADMEAKIADLERKLNDSMGSLKWNKDRAVELETKLSSLQEDLTAARDAAAANEERFTAELSTVNKLVGLYKKSSEEWSQKAGELEGVIKALETHMNQVKNDYKEKLDKETSAKLELEKETTHLKEKLERCEVEIEATRKANELNLLPSSSLTILKCSKLAEETDTGEDNRQIVPSIPVGISGTTLAASLLRDGWSLAKMYTKYQEAVDALRHEQLGRKQTQTILDQVLYEIEDKAAVILDERAEHEKMIEAYTVVNQKMQYYLVEQTKMEKSMQNLRAELRQHERDYTVAQKEIVDLQKQVTVLLKECRDVQLRCGASAHDYSIDDINVPSVELNALSETDRVVSERLLTFKDINGLVEQNVRLRSIVRNLSEQLEIKEVELKDKFERELQKQNDEAATKVNVVLMRAEEQGRMIESLHQSVAMYKRLCEEGHKLQLTNSQAVEAAPEDGRKDFMLLLAGSQQAAKKAQEAASDHVKWLEENVEKLRTELISVRSERDKFGLEVNFAREKLERCMKEVEHQRDETNAVMARNVEFSQLIIDYQRRVRESSDALHDAKELSRKLTMEVSISKHENEMLLGSEQKATQEVLHLSERVHRLQASLDVIQSAEDVREESRRVEKRKQEEHIMQIEKEWAEAKKELQDERDNVRRLMLDREEIMKSAMRQVEEIGKELTNSVNAVVAAEARATAAEAAHADLGKNKSGEAKVNQGDRDQGSLTSSNEAISDLVAKEEIQKLRQEAHANKEHMLQYKNIAAVNDDALKQMEVAHENFKTEADRVKQSLESQILSLTNRVNQLETECSLKSTEVVSLVAEKEAIRASCVSELDRLKMECALKTSQVAEMETKILALKEDLDKQHQRWRDAQSNYEKQVILQAETIHELKKASNDLGSLQEEATELHKLVDTLKVENNDLKTRWEVEKSILEKSKNDSEAKYREINEQNKILHNRLEALHIKLGEKEQSSSGNNDQDTIQDNGLQSIVNYLRRSKEIAETEISLLKQEKNRLQSQLESALKDFERSQASLHAERANARASLLTEEEFKSLQLQVRELNLLRESNLQLREENKQHFEECQKLHEMSQKANIERDQLETSLRVSQTEFVACKKEAEMMKVKKELLESRVHELLERCQNIDMDDYTRAKEAVQKLQVNISSRDGELKEMRMFLSQKDDLISQLESKLATSLAEVNEKESKLSEILQVENTMRLDLEKQRRTGMLLKKRMDNFSKEKDELNKEKQALTKQLEEYNSKQVGDAAGEQVIKEKDTKIQILERTVARQRELLKKEKEKDKEQEGENRQNAEEAVLENLVTDKSKLIDGIEMHKQALDRLSHEIEKDKQAKALPPAEDTSVGQTVTTTQLDEISAAYQQALESFENIVLSVSGGHGTPVVYLPGKVDSSTSVINSGQAAPLMEASIPFAVPPIQKQPAEEKAIVPKPSSIIESRKSVRRLVRPHMAKRDEPQGGDTEMLENEGSTNPGLESHGQGDTTGVQNTAVISASKKRAASTTDLSEEFLQHEETRDGEMPTLKKPRAGSDFPEETAAAIEENMEAGELPQEEEELNVEIGGEQEEEGKEMNQQLELHEDTLGDDNNNNNNNKAEVVPTEEEVVQQQQSGIEENDNDQEEGELISSDHDDKDLDLGNDDIINTTSNPMEVEMGEITEEAENEEEKKNEEGDNKSEDVITTTSTSEFLDNLNAEKNNQTLEAATTVTVAEKSPPMAETADAVVGKEETSSNIPKQGGGISASTATMSETTTMQSPARISTPTEDSSSTIGGRTTTINLRERAKEAAMIRQQGLASSSSSSQVLRGGRGGRLTRGRGRGRILGGRGQPPSAGGQG